MCSRCKACDSILSVYDLTVKRKVKLENGTITEVYEDMCSRCRSTIHEGEELPDDVGGIIEMED